MRQATSALDMIYCAQGNLENLANQVPQLRLHPFFKIVEMQIESSIKILNGESEQLSFEEHVKKIEGVDARN